ncbi:MAG: hypothetical protein GQ583_07080 [Methyloprofundus sp.]|nr:hypothetical protein [Methyloprofundus sp.]
MVNFNCASSIFAMPWRLPGLQKSSQKSVFFGTCVETYNYGESLIMKTEKTWNTPKTQAQPRSVKRQSAKAGIKLRSGVRAGDQIVFPDTF